MGMTLIQKQAIEMIKRLPDDKIFHVIHIMEGIEELFPVENRIEKEKSQKAYRELQKYRKSGSVERDYKLELAEALEDKYAGID